MLLATILVLRLNVRSGSAVRTNERGQERRTILLACRDNFSYWSVDSGSSQGCIIANVRGLPSRFSEAEEGGRPSVFKELRKMGCLCWRSIELKARRERAEAGATFKLAGRPAPEYT